VASSSPPRLREARLAERGVEAAARDLGQEFLSHHDGGQPIREAIVRFDGEPGELGAHALVDFKWSRLRSRTKKKELL
jgi:hypothetical protein